jgi:hypothetical protein
MDQAVAFGALHLKGTTVLGAAEDPLERLVQQARSAGLREYDESEIRRERPAFYEADGLLYHRTLHASLDAGPITPAVAFYVTGGHIVYLQPAVPATLHELQSIRAERAERAERDRAKLRAAARRPITLADIHDRPLPTIREAAQIVLEAGEIHENDGRLVVLVGDLAAREQKIRDAALVLHAESAVVTEALRSASEKPLDELLPNRAALP